LVTIPDRTSSHVPPLRPDLSWVFSFFHKGANRFASFGSTVRPRPEEILPLFDFPRISSPPLKIRLSFPSKHPPLFFDLFLFLLERGPLCFFNLCAYRQSLFCLFLFLGGVAMVQPLAESQKPGDSFPLLVPRRHAICDRNPFRAPPPLFYEGAKVANKKKAREKGGRHMLAVILLVKCSQRLSIRRIRFSFSRRVGRLLSFSAGIICLLFFPVPLSRVRIQN